jgi:hypothetical protein
MALIPKEGQRLEPIVYYCNIRKKKFKRNVLIDDDFETRRALCGVEFILKAMDGNNVKIVEGTDMYLLVKSINGKATGHGETKSVAALLFGKQHARARRLDPTNPWDLTREAYGLQAKKAVTA